MAQIITLNSVAANGADVVFAGGNINIAGKTLIPYDRIVENVQNYPYVAAVAQVTDLAFTSANSTTFTIAIKGLSKLFGTQFTWYKTIVSDASSTATKISNAFIALINSDPSIPVTASLTGTDLRLTAQLPAAIFTVTNALATTTTIGFTATTPGVVGIGLGSYILAGDLSSPDVVATNTYNTTIIQYYSADPVNATNYNTEIQTVVVYTNQGDADYPSLVGTYGTLTQATIGITATWSAAAATGSSVTNGVLTLGGSDVFYGNADVNVGLQDNDAILIDTEPYIINILSATTASTANIPNDHATGVTRYIKLRKTA